MVSSWEAGFPWGPSEVRGRPRPVCGTHLAVSAVCGWLDEIMVHIALPTFFSLRESSCGVEAEACVDVESIGGRLRLSTSAANPMHPPAYTAFEMVCFDPSSLSVRSPPPLSSQRLRQALWMYHLASFTGELEAA